MTLARSRYGKARVRIMRVTRDEPLLVTPTTVGWTQPVPRQDVHELSLDVMLEGAFDPAFKEADNSSIIATDSIKNLINLAARQDVRSAPEPFIERLAGQFLDRYGQIDRVTIDSLETRWTRLAYNGQLHPHAFTLDANGRPFVGVQRTRNSLLTRSGIRNFTFLKSTGSGFSGFLRDDVTTLPETRDRLLATSMDATWLWSSTPNDHAGLSAVLIEAMLRVFADTYSESLQDSLYRMGEAALAAVEQIAEITLACPNKHYLPIDLERLGASSDDLVYTPSDEPYGLIECTMTR